MKFEITPDEHARVRAWLVDEVYPAVIAEQKAFDEQAGRTSSRICLDSWEQGFPYGGAIGGDVTYQFTPTSLGMVTKVSCYEHELDLTDYHSW